MRTYLAEEVNPTDVHYPQPPYLQPCYVDEFGPKEETTASLLSKSCISLPIANVNENDAAHIAAIINNFKL